MMQGVLKENRDADSTNSANTQGSREINFIFNLLLTLYILLLLEANIVTHHGVSQALLLSDMCFWCSALGHKKL